MNDPDPNPMDALLATLSEHMDCAVLVGYTLDGERVQLNLWQNKIQRDAIETRLKHALESFEDQPIPMNSSDEEDGDDEDAHHA